MGKRERQSGMWIDGEIDSTRDGEVGRETGGQREGKQAAENQQTHRGDAEGKYRSQEHKEAGREEQGKDQNLKERLMKQHKRWIFKETGQN